MTSLGTVAIALIIPPTVLVLGVVIIAIRSQGLDRDGQAHTRLLMTELTQFARTITITRRHLRQPHQAAHDHPDGAEPPPPVDSCP